MILPANVIALPTAPPSFNTNITAITTDMLAGYTLTYSMYRLDVAAMPIRC